MFCITSKQGPNKIKRKDLLNHEENRDDNEHTPTLPYSHTLILASAIDFPAIKPLVQAC
jgi:hypothetical protein